MPRWNSSVSVFYSTMVRKLQDIVQSINDLCVRLGGLIIERSRILDDAHGPVDQEIRKLKTSLDKARVEVISLHSYFLLSIFWT